MWNLLTVILSPQLRKWTEDRWDNISWLNTSFFYFEFEKKDKNANSSHKYHVEIYFWRHILTVF